MMGNVLVGLLPLLIGAAMVPINILVALLLLQGESGLLG
jgi:hypothetical protein